MLCQFSMKKLTGLLTILFLLSGCYQTSISPMMVAGPIAGASQGSLVSSALSTGFNYVVKEETGKFPYQHIVKRETEKIVNKVVSVEKTIIKASKDIKSKLDQSPKVKSKAVNLYNSVTKIKKIAKETFVANKPRYSYLITEK